MRRCRRRNCRESFRVRSRSIVYSTSRKVSGTKSSVFPISRCGQESVPRHARHSQYHICRKIQLPSSISAAQPDSALPFPRKAYPKVCALPGRPEIDGAALPGALRFPTVGFRKFPLFLTCVPRAQSKTAPRLWQILLITTSAARMEQVDWARSLAEQCRYAEPDPA